MFNFRLFSGKTFGWLIVSFFIFSAGTAAASAVNPSLAPKFGIVPANGFIFPYIYFTNTLSALRITDANRPYWVHTGEELDAIDRAISDQTSMLLNNDILIYYGHPYSRNMGILGRYSIEELSRQLSVTAAKYKEVNGGRNVKRAFYLIYGTVWPEGEIGILRRSTLMRYIEYALENDMLVFIDHQMGRHDPIQSLQRMFRYLHYPNVHLALDPEWRTNRPNIEIGHLTAEEINRAQQVMEDYIIANNLPGERMLMLHQFHYRMIRNRDNVRADFRRVRLVLCISGIGTPAQKRATYAAHGARSTNIPIKGFKLWYDFGFSGHTDNPLMTPTEVMSLEPRPFIIMYQ